MHALSNSRWTEFVIALVLACVAAGSSYARALSLDPVIYSYGSEKTYYTSDVWFDADIPKMFTMMNSRAAPQHQVTSEHPLLSLVVYVPVFVLRRLAGFSTLQAVRLLWSLLAALWTAALYLLLRVLGCRPFDAAVFTLLGTTSAASVFWFAVPEAFSLGSLTILLALLLFARLPHAHSPLLSYFLLNVLTLSITVTNWMVGFFAAVLNMRWWRALLIIAASFVAVSALWLVERLFFPQATFFVGGDRPLGFVYFPDFTRIVQVASSFLSHTMVMPAIQVWQKTPVQRMMIVQPALPGSGSALGYVAAIAWIVLLGLGIWACFTFMRKSPLMRLVGLTAAAQLALHLVFGRETFLYSMHFLPLLILIAACITFTRFRVPGLALAVIVVIGAAIQNNLQFVQAVEVLRVVSQLAAAYH
jgi:hypothetical protein